MYIHHPATEKNIKKSVLMKGWQKIISARFFLQWLKEIFYRDSIIIDSWGSDRSKMWRHFTEGICTIQLLLNQQQTTQNIHIKIVIIQFGFWIHVPLTEGNIFISLSIFLVYKLTLTPLHPKPTKKTTSFFRSYSESCLSILIQENK